MRGNFRDAGVSDEGFERLIDGISRQVIEDYPDMMENIRTDAARQARAADPHSRRSSSEMTTIDPANYLFDPFVEPLSGQLMFRYADYRFFVVGNEVFTDIF